MYMQEIQKQIKKKRRNKEIYNNSGEIEKRDFSRIFIFILAGDKTSKENNCL